MTSRRSTRGTAAPRQASAANLMWLQPRAQRLSLIFCEALCGVGFVTSLASAQAKNASADTQQTQPVAPAATTVTQSNAPPGNAPAEASASTEPKGESAVANSDANANLAEGDIIAKVPVAAAPPEVKKTTANAVGTDTARPLQTKDELAEPGYVPGYSSYFSMGLSPYSPQAGTAAGGFTPGYAAPMPAKKWTFTFSGSANVSAQYTGTSRHDPTSDQSGYVLHTAPRVIEEYSSFTSSSSVPGHWVSLKFTYGTPRVAAVVTVDTWNPVEPTSYYQMGSNSNINNAYLAFAPEPMGKLRLRINAGQMTTNYGFLSKWNGGVYVNPMAAIMKGIGETTIAEYDLSDKVTLVGEAGIMTTRDGTPPMNYYSAPENGYRRQYWAGALIDHAHLGLTTKGPYEIIAELHYIDQFFQDERAESPADNPQTPAIDESYIRDPRIRLFAGDFKINHDAWGQLALGFSYINAKNAYPLKGLQTYGGDGEWLGDRWFGVTTGGTGKLFMAAINYAMSLGKMINYPAPFSGNGPDLVINTGMHWTKTWTDFQPYDGRVRWKGTVDGLYTFLRYVGVGMRIDHIVPNSYDSEETYNVVASRLQFKTDWTSREAITLMWAKWFYGSHTRNEGTGLRTPDRLDDNLFALNFNIWW